MWLEEQRKAFTQLKELVARQPVLKYFNPKPGSHHTVQCSDYGSGATLLQNQQPVAFVARTLTETERNDVQIEKECLAILFRRERFEHNVYSYPNISIQTGHKPLETIFKKSLLSAPKRL